MATTETPDIVAESPRRQSPRKRTRTALFVEPKGGGKSETKSKKASTRKGIASAELPDAVKIETKASPRRSKSSKKVKRATSATTAKVEASPGKAKKVSHEKGSPVKKRKSPAKTKKKAASAVGAVKFFSSDLAAIAPENPWIDLNVPAEELRPSATLTTGQSFSWTVVESDDNCDQQPADKSDAPPPSDGESGAGSNASPSAWGTHDATEWVGPLGNRVLSIRETPTSTQYRVLHGPTGDDDGVVEVGDILRDYFQLETPLSPLYEQWAQHDGRLARIAAVIPGVRILRQDPVECLFSFICSSNNNIPRIAKMLAAFRETYGVFLMDLPGRSVDDGAQIIRKLYSFPTLDALKSATDADLRQMKLGYRAKFIIETRDLLLESGGHDYLMNLRRSKDAEFVQSELIKFSGIGRKVADCVALFSLDQVEAIPVDVHVWHIACREYDPTLSSAKSLTPTIYNKVGELFRRRFPTHAGWGHSLLFVAELPSFRPVLPEDIVAQMDEWREQELAKKAAKKAAQKAAKEDSP